MTPPTLIPLALRLARTHGRGHGDPESAALLGLARALQQYDPSRGMPLRTYAAVRIKRELQHTERDASGWGRLRWEEIPRALRMRDAWDTQSPAEREWVEAHLPRAHEREALSLEAPWGEDECLRECVPDPAEPLGVLAERDWLRSLLAQLPEPEAVAVRLVVLEGLSQREAGRRCGHSQMECCRRLHAGLVRLRRLWEEGEA